MRLGNAADPGYATYGANTVRIVPVSAHPDEPTANAEGYHLHRAFINGGVAQPGFFRDKYDCSLNGNIASSIQGRAPLVSASSAGQPTFGQCTANGKTPTNNFGGAVAAARSRGAKFHPETIFQADALTRLSEAHAQASTSSTYCAWYDAAGVKNFPKGNNNNALKDIDDTTVNFTGTGNATYPAYALTGSGVPFAKTTHNGQACGVSDVNGNVWKVNPGMTCIGASKAITGATQTNPVQLTVTGHGYATGQVLTVTAVAGMTQINNRVYTITVVDANTISLDGVDGTAFSAYTSGGSCLTGTHYLLKPSADVAAMTGVGSGANDFWGATGILANYDPITLPWPTAYPNNNYSQRFGNGANAVFDWSTAAGRELAMAGMPAAGGLSAAGTNLFGLDYMEGNTYPNDLCVISRGNWSNGVNAGVRSRFLYYSRGARTLPWASPPPVTCKPER